MTQINKLKIINHPQFGEIRILEEKEGTLFCGNDVTNALAYVNSSKAISDHCPHVTKRDIGVQTGTKADGTPAIQIISMNFIPEGDLYRLVANSQLPEAKKFESWIFDEVLPEIRKTGTYTLPENDKSKHYVVKYPVGATSLGEVASFWRGEEKILRDQKSSPHKRARAFEKLCKQFDIELPEDFVEPEQPTFEQMMITTTITTITAEMQPALQKVATDSQKETPCHEDWQRVSCD